MLPHLSSTSVQSPTGYALEAGLIQYFEDGLDPLHPEQSAIPCRVLGYGEISTVFEIQSEGLHGLAFKRMVCFETLDEQTPYLDTYLLYNRFLEEQLGIRLPPYGYAAFTNKRGRPVFYIIQERLHPASIGSNALQYLSQEEILSLFRKILLELDKVWAFNSSHPECQVGIDGADLQLGDPGL